MSDDARPAPTPPVRAGGTLDLSTGPPAPPPPPAPRPPATPDPDVRVGRALDLSRKPGGPSRRRPAAATLGHGPVVRETIDLSTATPAASGGAPPPADAASGRPASGAQAEGGRSKDGQSEGGRSKHGGSKGGGSGGRGGSRPDARPSGTPARGVAPKAASSSLADLLDPEVLAKLRGG